MSSAWGNSFGVTSAVGDPLTYAETVSAVRAALTAENVNEAALEVINEGVKKASLLVPHTEDLP